MSRRNRGEAEDRLLLDGDVRHANVMTKLILSRELLEEAVDVAVAGAERRSVIRLPKRPDLNHATNGARRSWTSPSRSVSGWRRRTSWARPAWDAREHRPAVPARLAGDGATPARRGAPS